MKHNHKEKRQRTGARLDGGIHIEAFFDPDTPKETINSIVLLLVGFRSS